MRTLEELKRFLRCRNCGQKVAEAHAVGIDADSQSYAVTSEGRILFERILEVRRRPISVLVIRDRRSGETGTSH